VQLLVDELNTGEVVSRPLGHAITSGPAALFLLPHLGGHLSVSGALGTGAETPISDKPLFTAASYEAGRSSEPINASPQ
jgi:hypothetical protein